MFLYGFYFQTDQFCSIIKDNAILQLLLNSYSQRKILNARFKRIMNVENEHASNIVLATDKQFNIILLSKYLIFFK